MHSQAKTVFDAFAAVKVGLRPLALLLDCHPTTLYKWNKPVAGGGTGGLIPSKWWPDLLRLADERGVKIDLNALLRATPPREKKPRRRKAQGEEDIFA